MNIYQFFSCFTLLPVPIDTVVEHVCDNGAAATISYHAVDVDPAIVAGICRVYHHKPVYAAEPVKHADIIYSSRLPEGWQRLVICKELLHLLDGTHEMAHTPEQVSQLIDEILVPTAVQMSVPGLSDHVGLLNALKILLPRDALAELAKAHAEGKITEQDLAAAAKVPVVFASLALKPEWQKILEDID